MAVLAPTTPTSAAAAGNDGDFAGGSGRQRSRSEALRLYVAHAIDAKRAGDASAFADILQQLEEPASARKLLKGLTWCINMLTAADWDLFDQLVKLLYVHTGDEAIGDLIVNTVVSFISSNPAVFLPKCYEVLVLQFTAQVDPTTGAPPLDRSRDEEERVKWAMEYVHSILQQLLTIFVSSSSILLSVLKAVYPYKALARPIQRAFLRNFLRVAEYAPSLRDDIIGLAVLKLMEIDVEIKLEDAPDDDHELFDMDGPDGHMQAPEDEEARAAQLARAQTVSVEADKLDDLMTIMFDFLRSVFAPASDPGSPSSSQPRSPSGSPPTSRTTHRYPVSPPSQSDVFRALLSSFESTVLTTWRCKYVQFLLFYASSFQPREYPDLFLRRLFAKLEDAGGRQESQMSAAYLGSFVGRAAFLEPASVRAALSHLVRWAHAYVDAHDAGVTAPDAGKHCVFYMVCQSAFYVLCYKWELLEEASDLGGRDRNISFLKGLRLQRVLESRLNPLKMCLPTVVTEFARVCHSLEIAHCSAVLRKNRALVIPTRTSAAGGSSNELDSFFPFDPYLLKRSHPFVDPLYQTWKDTKHKDSQSETSTDDEEDEDEDEEESAAREDDGVGDMNFSRSLNLGPSPMATSLLSRSSPLTAASPAPSSSVPEESDADGHGPVPIGASPDPMTLSTTPVAPSAFRSTSAAASQRGRPPRGGLSKAGSIFAVSSPQLVAPSSGVARGGPCRRRLRSPTPSPIP